MTRTFSSRTTNYSEQPDPAHSCAPQPTLTLPHLTPTSEIHIIPISNKPATQRTATAAGYVSFSNLHPHNLVRSNALRKGDVLAVARVAGVMAAKKTADWVPLCHSGIGIEGVRVVVELVAGAESAGSEGGVNVGSGGDIGVGSTNDRSVAAGKGVGKRKIGRCGGVNIEATVECYGKTGVEMEALAGVVGAALTVVDMCKGVDRGCRIEGVRVVKKEGGRSGIWIEDGWVDAVE